jgi:hypothetical protein
MAHIAVLGHGHPVAAPVFQQVADFDIEGLGVHAASVAKFCGARKQHFAPGVAHTLLVAEKTETQIVAEALRYYMGDRWNNTTLGKAAEVSANTIANCLDPDKRAPSASGKVPSVKVTELGRIARALGLTAADLLTDATDEERRATYRKRAAAYYAEHGVLPAWAPSPDKANGTDGP